MSNLQAVIGGFETRALSDPLRPDDHIDSESRRPATSRSRSSARSAGCASSGGSSRACARRCCCCCCSRSRRCPDRSCRSARPTRTASSSTCSDNPELAPVLDALGLFSTFSIAVVLGHLPAAVHLADRLHHPAHEAPLRRAARPPAEDARAARAAGRLHHARRPAADAGAAIDEAATAAAAAGLPSRALRRDSVSAERGYLRETGNLVFHTALVGMLVAVGIGGGFGYTGQRVIVEGAAVHQRARRLRLVQPRPVLRRVLARPVLAARSTTSTARYEPTNVDGQSAADRLRRRRVTRASPAATGQPATIKVNSPLTIGGTEVYLLGNGYAPVITVRDPDGEAVFSGSGAVPAAGRATSQPRRGQGARRARRAARHASASSTPTRSAARRRAPSPRSRRPSTASPLLTLFVYAGDLGLDDGSRASTSTRSTSTSMTQLAGGDADAAGLELTPGRDRRPARRPRHHRVRGRCRRFVSARHPPRPDAGLGARCSRAHPGAGCSSASSCRAAACG